MRLVQTTIWQKHEYCGPRHRLRARADLQLQKDMFDVRFHCLGRDLKGASNAFIGETLADLREDIAFPRSERIADAAAGLRGAGTRVANIPLRMQTYHKRWKFAVS